MQFIGRTLAPFIVALSLAATAQASPVTVGSPLGGGFEAFGPVAQSTTLFNLSLGGPTANATSPVSGTIVRWHLLGGEGGPYRLRVLRPAGGAAYTGVGSSAAVNALSPGLETFSTALPIQAGDTIGVDLGPTQKIGLLKAPTSSIADWLPVLTEGVPRGYTFAEAAGEFGFNAEVQVPPLVTLVSPASGTIKGGAAVTVVGTDFSGATGVSFGGAPASSFAISSDTQLTAVAPTGRAGKVNVTVTTVAGTSVPSPADRFEYRACVVPNLKAKKLKGAKKKLRKAGCKVGSVKRTDGVTAKTGEVVKQGSRTGKQLPPGTKVRITLG